MTTYIVGIDEAGRGPLAGPLAVAAYCVPSDLDLISAFPKLTDSKKLSEPVREELFKQLKDLRGRTPQAGMAVTLIRPETIDRDGVSAVLRTGVARLLKRLDIAPEACHVKLDGTLRAPAKYSQETIVGGDLAEPSISAASIIAKVTRDRKMRRYDQLHPAYGFAGHKGYGTKTHRAAIQKHGPCEIHRKRFLTRILNTEY